MPAVPGNLRSVRAPKPATLARYGLTRDEWLGFLLAQGGVCAICRKVPPSGRWATDHEHVRKWRRMKPAERRRYVRGVVCASCNHRCLGRFITLDKARAIVTYLKAYHTRLKRQKNAD